MNDRPSSHDSPGDQARTIRDVARLAGVSIGTASKALNASGRLSAETRARVLKVAQAIDYEPFYELMVPVAEAAIGKALQ